MSSSGTIVNFKITLGWSQYELRKILIRCSNDLEPNSRTRSTEGGKPRKREVRGGQRGRGEVGTEGREGRGEMGERERNVLTKSQKIHILRLEIYFMALKCHQTAPYNTPLLKFAHKQNWRNLNQVQQPSTASPQTHKSNKTEHDWPRNSTVDCWGNPERETYKTVLKKFNPCKMINEVN